MADGKRYAAKYPDLELTLKTQIESWETVFKSRHNKTQLKMLITKFLTDQSNNLLRDGQIIYLNGGIEHLPTGSVVKISKKRGEPVSVTTVPWSLIPGESDHKIFQFIRFWREDRHSPDILIFSLDTECSV